jgi:hypothetical protein
MSNNIKVECPKCEWQPDGKIYWKCSCGHSWNTFETRAKCPACNKQWETTRCPGCGKSTPHEEWYIDESKPGKEYSADQLELRKKKKQFESRLISLGIKNYRVSHLEFLDHTKETFQPPLEVGCRTLILYGLAYAAHNLDERISIADWFKRENIWDKVSNNEKEFLYDVTPENEKIVDVSWAIEAALTLAWTLNVVDTLPEIDRESTDDEIGNFLARIPKPGENTKEFLQNLSYRNLEEIYEENLVNEAVTAYLRDIVLLERKDETNINRMTSFERHRVLNWVRQFMGEKDWDEISTST